MFFDKLEIDKNYGADMSMSVVCDENGEISIGCRFSDSDGRDISCEGTGDDYDDVMSSVTEDLVENIINYERDKEESDADDSNEKIRELEDKIRSLEFDNEILKKRLKDRSCNALYEKGLKELLDSFDKIDWRKYL